MQAFLDGLRVLVEENGALCIVSPHLFPASRSIFRLTSISLPRRLQRYS